jgi:predicted nucleic acid-binding protein
VARQLRWNRRFDQLLNDDLESRVLDFDSAAANAAALVVAARQKMGQPVDLRDTQIAGIYGGATRHSGNARQAERGRFRCVI